MQEELTICLSSHVHKSRGYQLELWRRHNAFFTIILISVFLMYVMVLLRGPPFMSLQKVDLFGTSCFIAFESIRL